MTFAEGIGLFFAGALIAGAYFEHKCSMALMSLRNYHEDQSSKLSAMNHRLWNEFKLYREKTEEFIFLVEDNFPQSIETLEEEIEWFSEHTYKWED